MRIMHLSSEYPPIQVFGLGRAVRDLAVAQASLGHRVEVITNSIGGRDKDAVVDGVGVHRISFPPPPKPPDDTMAVTQFNVSVIEAAAQLIDATGAPDVFHVHDWLTVQCGKMLKWLHPSAALAVTIHDTAHGKHFGRMNPPVQYTAHLERYACEQADLTICCSEYVRQELLNHYYADPGRVKIIPCGVDEWGFRVDGDCRAFRNTFAAPDDCLILYVGRLDEEKGLPHLLEALAHVLLVEGRARLVIAGKGMLQQSLQQRAGQLQIGDRVRFAGYVTGDALAGLYRSADVLVVPSLYEPFGLVALEGMICGTPVVVSDTGGLSEIVEDGHTGLRVPPADAAALGRAILRVLSDGDLATRIGQAGAAHARERYNWRDIAVNTVAAYEHCHTQIAGPVA
jgi:glycogen(starch) synthase